MQAYVLRTDTLVLGVFAGRESGESSWGEFQEDSQRDVPRRA